MRSLAPAILALTLVGPASADEVPDSVDLVPVPSECGVFWTLPGGPDSPVAWLQVLSFAACIQDATVANVRYSFQLHGFVEQLESALSPTLAFDIAAMQNGPGPIKLRAAYQVGMTQVALMTRARLSIRNAPELRDDLETLLEPPARLAWTAFDLVDRVVAEDPTLAPDVVTQTMVRSARAQAAMLSADWGFSREESELPRLAAP